MIRRAVVLATFLAAGAAAGGGAMTGCGGAGAPARRDPASSRSAGERIADLRIRLAADPRDADLHLSLARALEAAGRPGGALDEYEQARRGRDLPARDRRALARLYLARARARLAQGDGDAWHDLQRVATWDPALSREAGSRALAREAYFTAALAALRRADRLGRPDALRFLDRAAPLAPGDPRLSVRDPARADLAQLAAAATWLSQGGARRAALDLYRGYVLRGGRGALELHRYLDLFAWWYGDRQRPDGLVLYHLARAGADLCRVARTLDDLGCGQALARAAEDRPREAEAIRRRAEARGWQTARPEVAAAWTLVALRAWVAGAVASWSGEVSARVDLPRVAAAAEDDLPLWAAPTLLRLAGKPAAASAAFDRALERAATLSPDERAVLLAEAAASGRTSGTIDQLLHAGPASLAAWRVALRTARERDPAGGAREATLLDQAPAAAARAHLVWTGDLGVLALRFPSPARAAALARWRAAMARPSALAPARAIVEQRWRLLAGAAALTPSPGPAAAAGGSPSPLPLGAFDPHRLPVAPAAASALLRIERAWRRDPVLADRLAADWVSGAVCVAERGLQLAELFARLDDPARAWRWARAVQRSSADHPAYLMAAGIASAAAGQVDRADVLFERAAARSGDGGATSLAAAQAYLATGHPRAAVTAAKRALSLTALGEVAHVAGARAAIRALEALGRAGDAMALRATLPPRSRPEAPRDAAALLPPPAHPAPAKTAPALAGAAADVALGLTPDASPARAAAALDRAAAALDRAGLTAAAARVRAERRAVAGPTLLPVSPRW